MKEPLHVVHEEYSHYKQRTDRNYNIIFILFGIVFILIGLILSFADNPSSYRRELGFYIIVTGIACFGIGYVALKFLQRY